MSTNGTVNHIRSLLLDGDGDPVARTVLAAIGVRPPAASRVVDLLLTVVYAPDLHEFTSLFDGRSAPTAIAGTDSTIAVFSHGYLECDDTACVTVGLGEVMAAIAGNSVRSMLPQLFSSSDPSVLSVLGRMRSAALSSDSVCAVGAVVLACAYRLMVAAKVV